MTAPYDAIADWYEDTFRPAQPADLLEYDRVVPEVLGAGSGPCLEVGCGTGAHADRIRRLGWTPVGVDLSAGMLRRGRGRLPAARVTLAVHLSSRAIVSMRVPAAKCLPSSSLPYVARFTLRCTSTNLPSRTAMTAL